MNGEGVAARDEHEALIFVRGEDGAAEGFEGFDGGEAGAHVLPDVLTGGGVEGEDVAAHILACGAFFELLLEFEGLVALEHLDVELAAVDGGAAAIGPLGGEGTVRLFEVTLPHDFTAEIARSGDGIGKEEINAVAIRGGGRAGEIALVIPLHFFALGDGGAPFLLAGFLVVAKTDEFFLRHDGRGDEDVVSPDDGDGGGDAWKVCCPLHTFLGAEFGWEAGFAAGAVLIGATPVRPVFGSGEGGEQSEGEERGGRFHG